MEAEARFDPTPDYSKHRVVRSNGEVTIEGLYPERAPGSYMIRTRIPGGRITTVQADALAHLADVLADGTWTITSRANIEFHGVSERNVVPLVEATEAIGITTRGACGDTVRNVVVGTDSLSPGRERLQALAEELTRQFAGRPEFETLPRKFKISFFAADDREPLHRINDLGFVEQEDGNFEVWIGGGLGRDPQLADLLFRGVPAGSVAEALMASAKMGLTAWNKAAWKDLIKNIP